MNVSHDEDDDEEAAAKKEAATSKLTLAEKEELASKISTERIFTQEDFKRIRLEQMKKKLSDKNFAKNKDKSKNIEIESDEENEDMKSKR